LAEYSLFYRALLQKRAIILFKSVFTALLVVQRAVLHKKISKHSFIVIVCGGLWSELSFQICSVRQMLTTHAQVPRGENCRAAHTQTK